MISTNFVEADDKGTFFKKHTPIFLFGISSISCTSYNKPLFKYSCENSFVTHAIPKFILANSNNKSCEPNSNSGDIFIPLDNIKSSTYCLELDFGSRKMSGSFTNS